MVDLLSVFFPFDSNSRKCSLLFASIFVVILEPTSSTRCLCGTNNPFNLRVVGGVTTKPHEFPWQVAITGRRGRPFCGGSLMNNKYVLTAAHCLYERSAWQITIVLGEHDWLDTSGPGRRTKLQAERLILHPNYDPARFINDIALIKLSQAIEFNDTQRPACLPRPTTKLEGVRATVSGWGRKAEGGNVSQVLMKVEVPLIPISLCRKAYGDKLIVSSMLCGMFKGGGKDSCEGDSGGPLTYFKNERHYLIGLVSWGYGCARKNYPGVYTRVDQFYPWLDANTIDAKPCAD